MFRYKWDTMVRLNNPMVQILYAYSQFCMHLCVQKHPEIILIFSDKVWRL